MAELPGGIAASLEKSRMVLHVNAPNDEPGYAGRFPLLSNVVLEESWVLRFRVSGTTVTFDLDAVLAGDHPPYRPPPPEQLYTTLRARLTITGRTLTFQPSYAPPAIDATGIPDCGHVDTFQSVDAAGTMWELTGDWGRIVVADPQVSIAY
jgi:hypothetical protein